MNWEKIKRKYWGRDWDIENMIEGTNKNMNWESEEDMQRDVEENPELYEALADTNKSTMTRIDELLEEARDSTEAARINAEIVGVKNEKQRDEIRQWIEYSRNLLNWADDELDRIDEMENDS